MKVAIEVQRLFRAKKHGMEIVALELLKQLQVLDKDNRYCLFAKDDVDRNCISSTANFSIQTLPGFSYIDWEQMRLPSAVSRFKPDFLHCTCNTAPLFGSTPLMLTLHDIIYLEKVDFKGTAYQNLGNVYRRMVVPRVVKKSKLVVTVSNFEKQTIVDKLQLPDEKVQVVYNAVNGRFNNAYGADQVEAFRNRFGLPERFVLFLGNTAPKKNTPNVIKAFAAYCRNNSPVVPLVVLDYDKSHVVAQLNELNAASCISHFIFPGYIPSAEMPLMYNAATLFLYPSLRESFGLPILEAMGCGTAVITSNTSSMPEVAGGAALLVDPYQPDAVMQAMSQVLSDDELQKFYAQKGLERAAEFTWEASARQLLSLYHRMVS